MNQGEQLFVIEYRRKGGEWDNTGDEPMSRENAEYWAADYRQGLELLYEYRTRPATSEEVKQWLLQTES